MTLHGTFSLAHVGAEPPTDEKGKKEEINLELSSNRTSGPFSILAD